ncbi:MAG: PaaI family thioesterase [Candidatus Binatia bacterium]
MSARERPVTELLAAAPELPGFFHHLGMSVERATAQEAVVRMQVPKWLLSPYGPVHGGAIAALIDTTIGVAVACRISQRDRTATHELNINYISFAKRPVVIATARVLRLGRTVAHTEAEARAEDGTLVAKALATFGIVRRSAGQRP